MLLLLACADPAPATGERKQALCDEQEWYADADGDGWGANSARACEAPEGYVAQPGDCDDRDVGVNPNAVERCDGVDEDCDGQIDEELPTTLYGEDLDGDGFGDPATAVDVCAPPAGYLADTNDCNDTDATVNPAAPERCNGFDDDCDGLVDDDDPTPVDAIDWAADADGDGYGDPANLLSRCVAPAGHLADAGDCDDTDATVNPAAMEVCLDLVDQDCDGIRDDYTDECKPQPPETSSCDAGAVPVDVVACVDGVAAVLPSGATYGTVQDGIDAATAGDVVSVCPGTWLENLNQRVSPITLAGYGADVSVISGPGPVITMRGYDSLTVVDLAIENGTGTDGGGITALHGDVCVARCRFTSNIGSFGGAIYVIGSGTLTVEDSTFDRNDASDGGAINTGGVVDVSIRGATFEGNSAANSGGALDFDSDSTVAIVDTIFNGNYAGQEAGAVKYGGGAPGTWMVIASSQFIENSADTEGGALKIGTWDYPEVSLQDCLFQSNSSEGDGGAIALGSGAGLWLTVTNSQFVGNVARNGGALDVQTSDSPEVQFSGCTFDGNAAESGAAIDAETRNGGYTTVTVADSVFVSNATSDDACGAVTIDDSPRTVLESIESDWSAGQSDNTPDDVCGYTWDDVETFTCVAGVCR